MIDFKLLPPYVGRAERGSPLRRHFAYILWNKRRNLRWLRDMGFQRPMATRVTPSANAQNSAATNPLNSGR